MRKFGNFVGKRRISAVAGLLQRVLGVGLSESAAQEPTGAFWSDPRFLSWLKSNGVEWSGGVPKYADGGEGRAYFVGKHVVKFTRDRVGANVAHMCIGVPFAPAPVIAVWRVPGQPLWAILQWLVHPEKVSGEIQSAADYLSTWIDENPSLEHFPTSVGEQEVEAKKLLGALGGPASLVGALVLLMGVHNKLYFSTGFTHTDGGPTNISMHGSDVVYHDLGPNMTAGYKPRAVLDKVHANRRRLGLPDAEEV